MTLSLPFSQSSFEQNVSVQRKWMRFSAILLFRNKAGNAGPSRKNAGNKPKCGISRGMVDTYAVIIMVTSPLGSLLLNPWITTSIERFQDVLLFALSGMRNVRFLFCSNGNFSESCKSGENYEISDSLSDLSDCLVSTCGCTWQQADTHVDAMD